MLVITVETPGHEDDMVLVITGPESLKRMQAAAPPEIVLRGTGKTLVNPSILLCHEADETEVRRLIEARDMGKLVCYLGRGWPKVEDPRDKVAPTEVGRPTSNGDSNIDEVGEMFVGIDEIVLSLLDTTAAQRTARLQMISGMNELLHDLVVSRIRDIKAKVQAVEV